MKKSHKTNFSSLWWLPVKKVLTSSAFGLFTLACFSFVTVGQNYAYACGEKGKKPKKDGGFGIFDASGGIGALSGGGGFSLPEAPCFDVPDINSWIDPAQNDGVPPDIQSMSPSSGSQIPIDPTLILTVSDSSPLLFRVSIDGTIYCQTTQYYNENSEKFTIQFPIVAKYSGIWSGYVLRNGQRLVTIDIIDKGGNTSSITAIYNVYFEHLEGANQTADEAITSVQNNNLPQQDKDFLLPLAEYFKAGINMGTISPLQFKEKVLALATAAQQWDRTLGGREIITEEEKQLFFQELSNQMNTMDQLIAMGRAAAASIDGVIEPDFSDPDNPYTQDDWDYIHSVVSKGLKINWPPGWLKPWIPWIGVTAGAAFLVADIANGYERCADPWDRFWCWVEAAAWGLGAISASAVSGGAGIVGTIVGLVGLANKLRECILSTLCCKIG